MSKQQVERTIRAELSLLNSIIDQKIIYGRGYKREATRHKQLLTQLTRLERAHLVRASWFGRASQVMASFVL